MNDKNEVFSISIEQYLSDVKKKIDAHIKQNITQSGMDKFQRDEVIAGIYKKFAGYKYFDHLDQEITREKQALSLADAIRIGIPTKLTGSEITKITYKIKYSGGIDSVRVYKTLKQKLDNVELTDSKITIVIYEPATVITPEIGARIKAEKDKFINDLIDNSREVSQELAHSGGQLYSYIESKLDEQLRANHDESIQDTYL